MVPPVSNCVSVLHSQSGDVFFARFSAARMPVLARMPSLSTFRTMSSYLLSQMPGSLMREYLTLPICSPHSTMYAGGWSLHDTTNSRPKSSSSPLTFSVTFPGSDDVTATGFRPCSIRHLTDGMLSTMAAHTQFGSPRRLWYR